MPTIEPDTRSPDRRAADERIAAEPEEPIPPRVPGTVLRPVEDFFPRPTRRPAAVAGIVENGLVRPLDPQVRLPEHARVIIVSTD